MSFRLNVLTFFWQLKRQMCALLKLQTSSRQLYYNYITKSVTLNPLSVYRFVWNDMESNYKQFHFLSIQLSMQTYIFIILIHVPHDVLGILFTRVYTFSVTQHNAAICHLHLHIHQNKID